VTEILKKFAEYMDAGKVVMSGNVCRSVSRSVPVYYNVAIVVTIIPNKQLDAFRRLTTIPNGRYTDTCTHNHWTSQTVVPRTSSNSENV